MDISGKLEFIKKNPRYSDVVLLYGELISPCAKDTVSASMCNFPDKDIKFSRWLCVLNCCSKCPVVFVPGAEINFE